MKERFFLLVIIYLASLLSAGASPASDSSRVTGVSDNFPEIKKSGKWFVQAGFNWSDYSKTDIRFRGNGYDFTLQNVKAQDQPYKGSLQYNFHVGYSLNEKYSVILGWDHMKYVMDVPQQVPINGFIESSVSNPSISSGQYQGVYSGETITINPDFLTLEYTDGLNYIKLGAQRQDEIWTSAKGKSSLKFTGGLSGGLIIPRADVRLFTVGDNNKLNVAGWAASANAGLKFKFSRDLYFQGNLEGGYTNLNNVHTTGRNEVDKASHHFLFLQNYWLFGFQF
ncbi:hypothetical protein [Daejeonella oryzae]|uniref:hypothetical protein n=1 Tax=Daejeonella oryzae TaxID=1122943 RepID=UPI0003FB06C8|nr:hypothetical protein [Daejeonella oryzae]